MKPFVTYLSGFNLTATHTNAGTSHSLRPVAAWTGAVVAPSGVLTDLIVSTLVSSVPALVDV